MNRGYYTAAQAMINQQRILDAISNNVSNVNTAGYRKDEIVTNTFQEELFLVNSRTETSGTYCQTYVDTSKTNLEQGGFEFTGSRYDIAIYGNVYFNIRHENGNIYQTRNGQFELDNEGYLILGRSGRVQGLNGDIYLGSHDFEINDLGQIITDDGVTDSLLLTYIPVNADVDKYGENLYTYLGNETLPEDQTYTIIQGAFEKSNVDSVKEMTQAMEAQRMYEANSKILQYFDTINRRSAQEIAQI